MAAQGSREGFRVRDRIGVRVRIRNMVRAAWGYGIEVHSQHHGHLTKAPWGHAMEGTVRKGEDAVGREGMAS